MKITKTHPQKSPERAIDENREFATLVIEDKKIFLGSGRFQYEQGSQFQMIEPYSYWREELFKIDLANKKVGCKNDSKTK